MKKYLVVLLGLMLCLGFAAQASADQEGMATAHVFVTVAPNITVGVATPLVDAGSVQTGPFTATIVFSVDANEQEVEMWAAVSDLYKGDDPTGEEVTPIPVNEGAGVLFAPTNANPLNGGSPVASYIGPGDAVLGFPTTLTESIIFTSSQNGHFSQQVFVTAGWTQVDPEQPQGQYSGSVKFYSMLVPDQNGGTNG